MMGCWAVSLRAASGLALCAWRDVLGRVVPAQEPRILPPAPLLYGLRPGTWQWPWQDRATPVQLRSRRHAQRQASTPKHRAADCHSTRQNWAGPTLWPGGFAIKGGTPDTPRRSGRDICQNAEADFPRCTWPCELSLRLCSQADLTKSTAGYADPTGPASNLCGLRSIYQNPPSVILRPTLPTGETTHPIPNTAGCRAPAIFVHPGGPLQVSAAGNHQNAKETTQRRYSDT